MSVSSWRLAAEMVSEFLKQPARLQHLMERLPAGMDAGARRQCQALLFGTVRHLGLLEKGLGGFLRRRPKPGLYGMLLVASRELMEDPEKAPVIVHHAVEAIGTKYSRAEKGLANAVLRKMPSALAELQSKSADEASAMAWRYSHPEWWVERWVEQFGTEDTRRFLEWNQREPEVFGRWRRGEGNSPKPICDEYGGYVKIGSGDWAWAQSAIEKGDLYIQNPAARLAPALLAERFSGGRILDLCAAPGGKTLWLSDQLGDRLEEIVPVDLAGPRFERLLENLGRNGVSNASPVASDILELNTNETGLFEGVLLDAPCSNSGVLQHKVDVKWRMSRKGVEEVIALQLVLLQRAAQFVSDGGCLVYSTCSVDTEENEGIARSFLQSEAGRDFKLDASTVSYPWRSHHDGAGAFAFVKEL